MVLKKHISFTGDIDYDSRDGVITFDKDNTLEILTFIIYNDSILEYDESFRVELTSDTTGVTLTTSFTTVTVIDNDGKYRRLAC